MLNDPVGDPTFLGNSITPFLLPSVCGFFKPYILNHANT